MSRVLVLGKDGMLGHAVFKVLIDAGHAVFGTTRADFDARMVLRDYKDRHGHDSIRKFLGFDGVDYVINAIGITIPRSLNNPEETLFVNGALPHILAGVLGRRLIHITTDCVYSGTDGKAPYDENSAKTPVDLYGLSKSLGEPENCITIRTSIIGREMKGSTGLLEWFHRQDTVNGFTNHYWNGITTYEFGRLCDRIIREGGMVPGVYHAFAKSADERDRLSKYEMLLAFKRRYGTDTVIHPVEAPIAVDRRLRSNWKVFEIPSFQEMVDRMP